MRLVSLALLAACTPQLPPTETWMMGERESALERQKLLAAEEGEEKALENVRLASMALAIGDEALAEEALRVAAGRMQDFQAEGEFKALLIAEETKEWKGEPYEKLAAFFTLGMLLYQEGDRGNALAMFKSAVIADAGSTEERYRSDFVPAYVMQALVYQAEGEPHNAEQAMGRAVDSIFARELTELLAAELSAVAPGELDPDDVALAKLLLFAGLPAGVTVSPRDPAEAARAAVSMATDISAVQRNLPRKERRDELQSFSDKDFERAVGAMGPVSELWRAAAAQITDFDRLQSEADRLTGLLASPPNVVLVVEAGRGPRKVQTGEYGQILQIVPGQSSASLPSIELAASGSPREREGGGAPGALPLALPAEDLVSPLYLDSYTYQGTTRGSRKVDGFLQGKAVYKETSMIAGAVLSEIADIAAYNDNGSAAAVMELAGAALWISGALTNPAADAREWGLIPDGLYLVAASLPPGAHSLTVDGRAYTLQVPDRGQLAALIPALAPGGDAEVSPRE